MPGPFIALAVLAFWAGFAFAWLLRGQREQRRQRDVIGGWYAPAMSDQPEPPPAHPTSSYRNPGASSLRF
jgi:hypothetical protein